MNLKKNALFYSFSSYNGIFPESLLIVQISQICATTEENRIALYLFFKLIQAPTGSIPAEAFSFSSALYELFIRKIIYENGKNSSNL